MSGKCSSTETLAALGYLRRSFTCYDLDAQAERSLLRTFQKFTAGEVMDALEDLKATSTHWPVAAAVEAAIRKNRRRGAPSRQTYLDETIPTVTTVPEDVRSAVTVGRAQFAERPWRDGSVETEEPK